MPYQVKVTTPDGRVHTHLLSKDEVIIGSDTGSDICLTSEAKLLPRHILLAPRKAECWVGASEGAPLWDSEGQPVQSGFVPWGSRLSLGGSVFELQDLKIAQQSDSARNPDSPAADKSNESRKTTNPIIIMLLLSTVAYLGIGLLGQPETMASALPSDPPKLFEIKDSCTSKNPLHRARAAEDEAFAKSERAVFAKQDGVSAVQLFAEAEACYRAAKDSAGAEFVAARGRSLRSELDEEYKLLRMRLGRALREENHSLARTQLAQLLALLKHQSQDRFVLSLRRLELKLSKEEFSQ